ncbi:SMP-30/gluconolactonase/LRE family protein [Beijerinckia indica]|uniref:SMP-30/Gluconolaconase/LRE domain protein n=1 Tax=Beijerinckia indica subsp. indica (strain ATCC 9039 / DSM 1715 / NCIMB 8712) TaxID=395963 RepID=B2IBK4_BEII9|nr:SMP-30/gluconolactonase/LRE family protein [Beijerinckia indica]ACB96630.1 SMP-30/Gluconolaconase/LRE domain protein [Beijerinckia indica subsp. indica ATCC 9039]
MYNADAKSRALFISRRILMRSTFGLAGAMAFPGLGKTQNDAKFGTPPSVITQPPRQWGPTAPPSPYPDPDILVLDPSFNDLLLGITAIRRVWTGGRWLEGPAWSSQGHYLVFSDVQADIQYRYIWETNQVIPYRQPSHNSNGNTFDFQGRQISTQDFFRRLVRWEHDGSMTVLSSQFEGKSLNSPNDIVPHPDGSLWFTDPAYGMTLSEGHPDMARGPANPQGFFNPRLGAENSDLIGGQKRELPSNVYRLSPDGHLDAVIQESQVPDPNGLCFSPDYKTLYVVSTAKAPSDNGPGGKGVIYAFDVQGDRPRNMRLFTDMVVDGVHCGPDGLRADIFGNLWCSSNGPLGYSGVLVFNPSGKLIGRLRLPEVCANVAFGGPKRNHLFMTASQSLYILQVQTQGAAPG